MIRPNLIVHIPGWYHLILFQEQQFLYLPELRLRSFAFSRGKFIIIDSRGQPGSIERHVIISGIVFLIQDEHAHDLTEDIKDFQRESRPSRYAEGDRRGRIKWIRIILLQ